MSGSAKSSQRALRFWQRMGEWYGARFAEQYGPKPPADWCELIDAHDNEIVKLVLSEIRSKHVSHPPTFPEVDALFAAKAVPDLSTKPDVRTDLTNYILRNHHAAIAPLTARQIASGWQWIVRWFDAPGPDGRMKHNHGCEYLGVIIPADGDSPGRRVMVRDMELQQEMAA